MISCFAIFFCCTMLNLSHTLYNLWNTLQQGGRLTVGGCKQLVQGLGQHIHHKRMWWLAFPVEFFLCLLRRRRKKQAEHNIAHTGLQSVTYSRGNSRTRQRWCGADSTNSLHTLSCVSRLSSAGSVFLNTSTVCVFMDDNLNAVEGFEEEAAFTCRTALSSYRSEMFLSRFLQMRTSLRATLIPPPVRGCLML